MMCSTSHCSRSIRPILVLNPLRQQSLWMAKRSTWLNKCCNTTCAKPVKAAQKHTISSSGKVMVLSTILGSLKKTSLAMVNLKMPNSLSIGPILPLLLTSTSRHSLRGLSLVASGLSNQQPLTRRTYRQREPKPDYMTIDPYINANEDVVELKGGGM
jgi:hypothetical protein